MSFVPALNNRQNRLSPQFSKKESVGQIVKIKGDLHNSPKFLIYLQQFEGRSKAPAAVARRSKFHPTNFVSLFLNSPPPLPSTTTKPPPV